MPRPSGWPAADERLRPRSVSRRDLGLEEGDLVPAEAEGPPCPRGHAGSVAAGVGCGAAEAHGNGGDAAARIRSGGWLLDACADAADGTGGNPAGSALGARR